MINNAQSASHPRNWKLALAYDGTHFSGWQVQPGERTVQGELQAALGRVLGETPLPQGSGRTDAGVHALAQVASCQLAAPIPPENLRMALNRTLPTSIRILDAAIVPGTFHARHSALAKTYEYRVFLEKPGRWTDQRAPSHICPPFLAPYVCVYPWPLDVAAMEEAARAFIGEHDFLSFAATDPELSARNLDFSAETATRPLPRTDFKIEAPTAPSVRRVFSSAWRENPAEGSSMLIYRVRGSGFLHHMVRNLVGTMLDVGRGQFRASQIPAILAARSRSAAGPTAPALGLFLHSVEYDAQDQERTGSA